MADVKDPLKCPHCDKPLNLEMVSRLKAESSMQLTLHPKAGELMTAKTVGGAIENISALLKACGKEIGVKTEVLVAGISGADGSVTVDLLITRLSHGTKSGVPPSGETTQNPSKSGGR